MKKIVHFCSCLFFFLPVFFQDDIRGAEPERVEPLVGAIRWDAWYGKIPEGTVLRDPKSYPGAPENLAFSPDPGEETRRALSLPKMWEWRMPFYTEFDEDGKVVDINGRRTEILEQEIELARKAGLDYWAFTLYPEDCPLSFTLKSFLECPSREKMKFCLYFVLARGNYGYFTEDPAMQEYVLRLVTQPNYLKVQGNRPVFYVGFLSEAVMNRLQSGFWKEFCDRVEAKGLGRPYVFACERSPEKAKSYAEALGADAISNYNVAYRGEAEAAPYRELAQRAEQHWDLYKRTGFSVAPPCMTGWDKRPRFLVPTSWGGEKKGVGYEQCYLPGTPEQVAEHIGRSFDWLKANPNKDGVHLSLIYAWNEYDEGGWLAPVLPPPRGEGNARLEALEKVLKQKRAGN